MNAGARLVCSARKLKHIAPLFRDLHWLRLPQRIEFKLAALVFRCLHGTAPQYLESELGALWQTLTRDADYVLHLRQRSTFHRLVALPSETAPSALLAPRMWNSLWPLDFVLQSLLVWQVLLTGRLRAEQAWRRHPMAAN